MADPKNDAARQDELIRLVERATRPTRPAAVAHPAITERVVESLLPAIRDLIAEAAKGVSAKERRDLQAWVDDRIGVGLVAPPLPPSTEITDGALEIALLIALRDRLVSGLSRDVIADAQTEGQSLTTVKTLGGVLAGMGGRAAVDRGLRLTGPRGEGGPPGG